MSFREKFWLIVALALFAIAHVTGVFMLGSTSAQEPSRAELINLGD
jgi:long-subunit fatty acid transport protein